jgi:uncharacterized protein (DUF305 family)
MKKRIGIIAAVVVLIGLAGIGVVAWQNRGGQHNERDEAFAANMVPHHEGAVEMADVLLAKDGIPSDVRAIAERIKQAQQPEIDQMNGWLEAWGIDSMEGHGGHTMMISGMMSDADMKALDDAQGTDAARLFLQGMITHHKGAIEMAQVEVDGGQYPEAVALARAVVADQTKEIAEMEQLLADL